MQVVPINAVPSQTFTVVLANQQVSFSIYQKTPQPDAYGVEAGLFIDISSNGAYLIQGVRCLDRVRLLLAVTYLGFVGDFMFMDVTGSGPPTFDGEPPYYTGLGSQFLLIYIEQSDLDAL
jgi:hypothetical protein